MKWRSVKLDPPMVYQFVWWGWLNKKTEMGFYWPAKSNPYICESMEFDEHWHAETEPTHWIPRELPDPPTENTIKSYKEVSHE